MRHRLLGRSVERVMGWLGGSYPRTGFMGLMDVLATDPAEPLIAGMTFYHGGGHLFLETSLDLVPDRDEMGRGAPPGEVGHDSRLEVEVLRIACDVFGDVIRLDPELAAVVGSLS